MYTVHTHMHYVHVHVAYNFKKVAFSACNNLNFFLVCVCVRVCLCVSAEAVVAESVVVIKKLLQLQPKENKDLIMQVAKLAGRVEVWQVMMIHLYMKMYMYMYD